MLSLISQEEGILLHVFKREEMFKNHDFFDNLNIDTGKIFDMEATCHSFTVVNIARAPD